MNAFMLKNPWANCMIFRQQMGIQPVIGRKITTYKVIAKSIMNIYTHIWPQLHPQDWKFEIYLGVYTRNGTVFSWLQLQVKIEIELLTPPDGVAQLLVGLYYCLTYLYHKPNSEMSTNLVI